MNLTKQSKIVFILFLVSIFIIAQANIAFGASKTHSKAKVHKTTVKTTTSSTTKNTDTSSGTTTTTTTTSSWKLVWSDEFNGNSIDTNKWWKMDRAGCGDEYQTTSAKNSFIDNGNLVIRAIKENYNGYGYTSARLLTYGLFSQKYGRFEARIKIPYGKGLWPAFWMEGADVNSVGWPKCGEIDIMENVGKQPKIAYGSIHGPNEPNGKISGGYSLPSGNLSDDYHIYAVEWDANGVSWYVDNTKYLTATKSQLTALNNWVFDKPFFVILNLSVGGDWGGDPDSSTVFPADMKVDYVRVYTKS